MKFKPVKRLLKLADGSTALSTNYYVRYSVGGRQTWRSLQTDNLEVARKNLLLLRQMVARERLQAQAGIPPIRGRQRLGVPAEAPPQATLGDVRRALMTAELPKRSSRMAAINSLCWLVRLAEGLPLRTDIEGRTVAECVTGFMAGRASEALMAANRGDELQLVAAKRTFNSCLICAKSVFAPGQFARGTYRKLNLPDVSSFTKARGFTGVPAPDPFTPFSPAEHTVLEQALPALKHDQPGVYVTFLLMRYGGLRNSEAQHCKREWFRRNESGQTLIDIKVWPYFRPKATIRAVGVQEWVARDILETAPGADWLVGDDNPCTRYHITHTDLNAWIKSILPGRDAYDLRKQAGSEIYRQTRNPLAAAKFLGHKSTVTTERFYAGMRAEEVPMVGAI